MQPAAPSRRRPRPRSIAAMVGILATVIAVVTGAVALLFQFVPGLKPEGPPTTITAEIAAVSVEPASAAEFMRRFHRADIVALAESYIDKQLVPELAQERQLSPSLIRRLIYGNGSLHTFVLDALEGAPGVLAYVEVTTHGFRQRVQSPTVALYQPGGHRLPPASANDPTDRLIRAAFITGAQAQPGEPFKQRAPDDRGVAVVWKDCDVAQRVVVRAELRDEDNRLVDVATSSPVRCEIGLERSWERKFQSGFRTRAHRLGLLP